MASQASLDALDQTNKALKDILVKLRPFLELLGSNNYDQQQHSSSRPKGSCADPQRVALAQTAVALSLGTLRYMSHRLRGSSYGRNPQDPLRLELQRMRQLLVQVQNKPQQQPPQPKRALSLLPLVTTTTTNSGSGAHKRPTPEANSTESDGKNHREVPIATKRLKS